MIMNAFTNPGGPEHREVVREAARFLDDRWPGEELGETWYDAVDLRILQMSNSCRCVCGQLGARLARHEGYVVRNPLQQQEIDLNLPRTEGISGFGLMTLHRDTLRFCPTDSENESRVRALLEAELELVALLRKRLGISEEEARVLPDNLRPAFWGVTPAHWWAEEIKTRRRRGTG